MDKRAEEIEKTGKQTLEAVKRTKIGVDTIQQGQQDRLREKILDWISSANFPAQQSDFIARRQQGTGQWFIDSPEFDNWINRSKQTLVCLGMPGAGKTMIAAIAIEHLSRTIQNDKNGVAYIYCNYKAQIDQTATFLLSAILKQLIQARSSIPEPVSRLYEHHVTRGTRPSLEEIFSTLQSVFRDYSRIYLVVDALDECLDRNGARSRLLAKIHNLQQEAGADLHLMVTSRFIPEITEQFKESTRLEVRASDADVERFIAGQIDLIPRVIKRDNGLQGLVQTKISQAVNGMFLLARLRVNSLLDKKTKAKVLSQLEKISKGSQDMKEMYNEAYGEAIERIEGQLPEDFAVAKSVLSWISYAQRPLTTGELCHALAVKPGDKDLDGNNIPDVEDIISVCAGLITVDEESNIIRLVHYTTQEYFERIREKWSPCAQLEITSACLTYLSFNPFRSGICSSQEELKRRHKQNVFLNYASRYWGQHGWKIQEQISEVASIFLQDGNSVSSALQAVSFYEPRTTGLHLTARLGLLYLSEMLLSRQGENIGISADSKDENGRTPLSWAAERGIEAGVKLLVERDDVKADSKDSHDQTPLFWATMRGREAVVKLLVERDDVEADSKDKDSRTPLSWAAGNGHEAVVKLLVKQDIKVNSKDADGYTHYRGQQNWGMKQL